MVLWSKKGTMEENCDVIQRWREWTNHVEGQAIDCGHFIQEDVPEETFQLLK